MIELGFMFQGKRLKLMVFEMMNRINRVTAALKALKLTFANILYAKRSRWNNLVNLEVTTCIF